MDQRHTRKVPQRLAETNGKPIAHPTIDQHHARMRFRRPAALPPPTKSTIAWRGGGSDQSLRPLPPKRQTSTCSRSVNTGLRLRAKSSRSPSLVVPVRRASLVEPPPAMLMLLPCTESAPSVPRAFLSPRDLHSLRALSPLSAPFALLGLYTARLAPHPSSPCTSPAARLVSHASWRSGTSPAPCSRPSSCPAQSNQRSTGPYGHPRATLS